MGAHCYRQYFPISGTIGEGRKKRPATGKISALVRVHEWHEERTKYGSCVKQLMEGSAKEKDRQIHFLMQTFNTELSVPEMLENLKRVMEEPVVEELVCYISDVRRCEGACYALMGMLGDRRTMTKKTWGFKLRRALQERLCDCGAADACAESILSWDVDSGKLKRKAACIELMAKLFEDNSSLSCRLIASNHRILIATVAGLEFIHKEVDLEGGEGNYDDDLCCARISVASRQLLNEINYQDALDEEVLKALWRVRR